MYLLHRSFGGAQGASTAGCGVSGYLSEVAANVMPCAYVRGLMRRSAVPAYPTLALDDPVLSSMSAGAMRRSPLRRFTSWRISIYGPVMIRHSTNLCNCGRTGVLNADTRKIATVIGRTGRRSDSVQRSFMLCC
jgi:hypothetical protein